MVSSRVQFLWVVVLAVLWMPHFSMGFDDPDLLPDLAPAATTQESPESTPKTGETSPAVSETPAVDGSASTPADSETGAAADSQTSIPKKFASAFSSFKEKPYFRQVFVSVTAGLSLVILLIALKWYSVVRSHRRAVSGRLFHANKRTPALPWTGDLKAGEELKGDASDIQPQ